jgi:hypothetical protein
MATEVMYTPDGPLPIVGGDAEFKITTEYTKLAVGAASTSVLVSPDGIRVIDAGVHLVQTELPGGRVMTEPSPILIETTIRRLRQLIGDRPVIEVLISHTHLDHIGLLEALSQVFEIRALRINAVQRLPKAPGETGVDFYEYEKAVEAGQRIYREEVVRALREQLRSEEAAWQNKQPLEADAGKRAARFEAYAEAELGARMKVIEATKLRVEVPTPSGIKVIEMPLLGEIPVVPTEAAPGETKIATVVDPGMEKAAAKGTRPKGKKLDTLESSWIIDLPGGRFLFFPDARAPDFGRLRAKFEEQLRLLGRPATFYQIWDIGHHAQSGFRSGSAVQLSEMVRLLHDFSRVTTQSGGKTVDAVMVSAKKSYVDPASVFILRSLGFEVFIAHSGEEVSLLEVTLRTGETVTGATARPFEGIRPADLLLRRAQAAINERNASIDRLEQEFSTLRRKRTAEANQRRAAIKEEVATLKAQRDAIEQGKQNYVEGLGRDLGKSPHGRAPKPLPQGQEPAQAEATALRSELTLQKVPDLPVVGEKKLAHFEAEVLVVTGLRQPVTATPEQQKVIDLRREVQAIENALPKSETPISTRTSLIERLKELVAASEKLSDSAIDPEGKRLAKLEIDNLQRQVAGHYKVLAETPGGKELHSRGPSGELVTHRIFVEKPATGGTPAGERTMTLTEAGTFAMGAGQPAMTPGIRRTLGGVEVLGRGMGVVMMVTSVAGLEAATHAPAAGESLTYAHHALGLSIGARMVAHVPVHMGEFAILSVLEILDTSSRPYATPEEAHAAATYDVIRNGITLGLVGIGQAMTNQGIRKANLGMIVAGQAISLATFLADIVMDKLGVYEWLERKFAFFPEDVTQVSQDIRRLMKDYRVILGGIELSRRSDESLTALGAKSPEEIRRKALAAAAARRGEARSKERELVSAFEAAYHTARTSFAGLRELDSWRDEFFKLQAQAEGLAPAGDPGQRELIEKKFLTIEKSITLDETDQKSIRGLKQWGKIRGAIGDLNDALDTVERQMRDPNFSGADWEKVATKERELSQMLDNARYRLEPAAQGLYRTTALLSKDSDARKFYEKELDEVERLAAQARGRLASAARGRKVSGGPRAQYYERRGPLPTTPQLPTSTAMVLDEADAALVSLREGIRDTSLPMGVLPISLASSSTAGAVYQTMLKNDASFAEAIFRLHATESALRSLLAKAQAMVNADPTLVAERARLKRLKDEFETAQDERKVLKMLLFPSELDDQLELSQAGERKRFAESLGQSKSIATLSEFEYAALESGPLADAARTLGDVESQLRLVPPGAKLFRFQGRAEQGIPVGVADVPASMEGHWPPKSATLADDVIVALIGDAPSQGPRYYRTDYVYILPINRKAIEFFGKRGTVAIMKEGHSLDTPYVPGKGP